MTDKKHTPWHNLQSTYQSDKSAMKALSEMTGWVIKKKPSYTPELNQSVIKQMNEQQKNKES